MGERCAPDELDRLAPSCCARRPKSRQAPRADAESFCGEVALLNLPLRSDHSITSSALRGRLMIALRFLRIVEHHFCELGLADVGPRLRIEGKLGDSTRRHMGDLARKTT